MTRSVQEKKRRKELKSPLPLKLELLSYFHNILTGFCSNQLPKLSFREEFEENFTPPYSVWKQRFCLAPGGDFFKPIREGKASVKTGHIETLTENGIQMKDGSFVEVRES